MPGKHWVSGSNPAHRKLLFLIIYLFVLFILFYFIFLPSIYTLHITAVSASLEFHHELTNPAAEKP